MRASRRVGLLERLVDMVACWLIGLLAVKFDALAKEDRTEAVYHSERAGALWERARIESDLADECRAFLAQRRKRSGRKLTMTPGERVVVSWPVDHA